MSLQHSSAYLLEEKRRRETGDKTAALRAERLAREEAEREADNEKNVEFKTSSRFSELCYADVCFFAQEAIDLDETEYSIDAIWQDIRKKYRRAKRDVPYSMTHDLRSDYARLWRSEHPASARLIKVRSRT